MDWLSLGEGGTDRKPGLGRQRRFSFSQWWAQLPVVAPSFPTPQAPLSCPQFCVSHAFINSLLLVPYVSQAPD